MIISVKHEMIVFWAAFLCAQAVGLLFDFFRALRKNIPHSPFFVAIEDIVFCFVSFRLFFDICYATNNGSLRWYIFASFICSMVIYFCCVSEYVISLWNLILRILKVFFQPFIRLFGFLGKKLNTVLSTLKMLGNTVITDFKGFFLNITVNRSHTKDRKK